MRILRKWVCGGVHQGDDAIPADSNDWSLFIMLEQYHMTLQFTWIIFCTCTLCISACEYITVRFSLYSSVQKFCTIMHAHGGLEIVLCGKCERVVFSSFFLWLNFWMFPNNCTKHYGIVLGRWHSAVQCLDTEHADIIYFWPSLRMEE